MSVYTIDSGIKGQKWGIRRRQERTELYHFGIKGQKWGIRRFETASGYLTEAGKKRYNEINGKYQKLKSETKDRIQLKKVKKTEESQEDAESREARRQKIKKAIKIGAAVTTTAVAGIAAYKISKLGKDAGIKKEDISKAAKAYKDSIKSGASDFKKSAETYKQFRGKNIGVSQAVSGAASIAKNASNNAKDALSERSLKESVSKYNAAIDKAAGNVKSGMKGDQYSKYRAAVNLLSDEYKRGNQLARTSGSTINRLKQLRDLRKDASQTEKHENVYKNALSEALTKTVRVRDGFDAKSGSSTYHNESTAMQMVDRYIEQFGDEILKAS